MIKKFEYTIKDLELSDESFLWDMIYQAIFVAPHEQPLSRDILQNPNIARYVKEWGKKGDIGFKVLINGHDSPVGAINDLFTCVCSSLWTAAEKHVRRETEFRKFHTIETLS